MLPYTISTNSNSKRVTGKIEVLSGRKTFEVTIFGYKLLKSI